MRLTQTWLHNEHLEILATLSRLTTKFRVHQLLPPRRIPRSHVLTSADDV
jgi:hypothetical protein